MKLKQAIIIPSLSLTNDIRKESISSYNNQPYGQLSGKRNNAAHRNDLNASQDNSHYH